MLRLADRGYRVLFVEPSQSFSRCYCRNRLNPLIGGRSREVEDRITVLTPPLALPFRHSSISSHINHLRWTRIIKSKMAEIGESYIDLLWVYEPRFSEGLRWLDYDHLIFDMVDDYLSDDYGGSNLYKGTYDLLERADLTVFTSTVLEKRYDHMTKYSCVVPNGYDAKMFRPESSPIPSDLPEGYSIVAGMVGTLFHHLDFELLEALAVELDGRGGSLILIGPLEQSSAESLHSILQMSNVYWLGAKPYREIPSYVNAMDMCLALFRKGRVASSVSPLKLYEYLGCGKPGLVSGLESFRDDQLYKFTYDLDMMNLGDVLTQCVEETTEYRKDRAELARATASWDARFNLLEPYVEDIPPRNRPGKP